MGHYSDVQSRSDILETFNHLSIYENFHTKECCKAVQSDGWSSYRLWHVDCYRFSAHVHTCVAFLGPFAEWEVHEQTGFLVLQCCSEHCH